MNAVAREMYDYYRPTTKESDLRLLETASNAFGIMMDAQKIIDSKGTMIVHGTLDIISPNPALKVRKEAFADYIKAMHQLRLTPNSRGDKGTGQDERAGFSFEELSGEIANES